MCECFSVFLEEIGKEKLRLQLADHSAESECPLLIVVFANIKLGTSDIK